ncbi:cysteine desulfurase family protein [Flavobacterium sp. Fl-77]|uniref:cysteine desulfurase n=1 Tax=Flavobacterium flavipigmentatum TaxID=2893884 RepID=A0AAJ2VWM6_9FLAO|nr:MULTISPECIES: cysteine desulfurase family protein [unclassified Flavobacterium]MDX6181658.1 cysteine desulfurase family protein [Flavobacterium sp. Fl-33]MDX6185308.1 cysteine desulfurase family protein [Flavobacterium sp. Fl-77]UFH37413.1 cysteine desulfurase [Flavobacterium sp. F-70]
MKKVYLDNASTTAIRPEVIQEMVQIMTNDFGNPSSTHSFGRNTKTIIELSRKNIAKHLNCSAQEIIFTSSGTESNNWILRSVVKDLKTQRIITSKIEHHAVLHAVLALQLEFGIQVDYVKVNVDGSIDLTHLSSLLSDEKKTIVSLMHVNNETGSILDLDRVGVICKQYGALFHSDTVQSVGKTEIDLQKIPVDFILASAHKFHGPKGVGFAFIRKNSGIQPLIFGGEQEKGLRAGTEAVHQIAGMAMALSLSYENLEADRKYIYDLKMYLIEQLEIHFPGFKINGKKEDFYNIINIILPFSADKTAMLLFTLDMKGIAVSRGSACQSGSVKPSHVLKEMLSETDLKLPNLRISFSHYNTKEDIDWLLESLKTL